MIDDPDDDKAMDYIEQYITKNRVHENLQGISNDFKDLVVSLIEVLRMKTVTLFKNVWIGLTMWFLKRKICED